MKEFLYAYDINDFEDEILKNSLSKEAIFKALTPVVRLCYSP